MTKLYEKPALVALGEISLNTQTTDTNAITDVPIGSSQQPNQGFVS